MVHVTHVGHAQRGAQATLLSKQHWALVPSRSSTLLLLAQSVGAPERGSHTSRDKGGHSKQGGGAQQGRRGNQDREPEWRGWESVRMGGSDNKGDGLASQPCRYRVPGQPLLNWHQVGGVSRSPDGLFAQHERDPTRGRPAVRGKGTYGGRPGQCVEEQGTWASRTRKHSEAGYGRPVDRGAWTAKTVKRHWQQPATGRH